MKLYLGEGPITHRITLTLEWDDHQQEMFKFSTVDGQLSWERPAIYWQSLAYMLLEAL